MLPEPARGGVVHLATYVDAIPNAVISSAAPLARYREEGGNLCFNVPHQIARPDRFAILEVWRNKAAPDGHDSAASTSHFRHGLKAIPSAPYDERVRNRTYVELVNSDSRAGTIHVLTHVEVTPGHLDDRLALLRIMSVHRDPRRRDKIERKVIG